MSCFSLSLLIVTTCSAQSDTSEKIIKRVNMADTIPVNQDAIYNRPFILLGKTPAAIGGYIEGNTNYFMEDGVTEGFSMELRRFNIFMAAGIGKRIKFLSELEFEHGTEEIELETALLDFELASFLNFRAGIILPQIGIFNANHDSPNWDFVDRPLSSTNIIPATLSEVGFGFFGKLYPSNLIISYDAYLVNGIGQGVVLNEEGKTFIPGGKSEEMFGEDNNGLPMINAKVSVAVGSSLEAGISYYGGVYNNFRIEGEEVDDRRALSLVAFDLRALVNKAQLRGEYVFATINVHPGLSEIYGTKQSGGFLEIVYPVMERKILVFDDAVLNLIARAEKVDFNMGEFKNANGYLENTRIYDEVTALVVGFSIRPVSDLVFKANYRYHWTRDILGNPPARMAGFQFGLASYF